MSDIQRVDRSSVERLEIIVPYKKDSRARARNRESFETYWSEWNVTFVDDYSERSVAYNDAAEASESEYIALADVDALIPFNQIHLNADLVYPFDHIINIHHRTGIGSRWPDPFVYGLFVIFNRKKFIAMGGENQNFRGWGCEDLERYYRALNNNMSILRSDGPAYHMDHGNEGRVGNPHIEHNWELMKNERDKYESRIIYGA